MKTCLLYAREIVVYGSVNIDVANNVRSQIQGVTKGVGNFREGIEEMILSKKIVFYLAICYRNCGHPVC